MGLGFKNKNTTAAVQWFQPVNYKTAKKPLKSLVFLRGWVWEFSDLNARGSEFNNCRPAG
jgi:hypothetical protein